jgi:RimJ/RimL family protein N-acetyltransferase
VSGDRPIGTLRPGLLRGEKVRLTTITEEDLPRMFEWFAEEEVMRYGAPYPALPQRIDEVRKWAFREDPLRFNFAVRALDDDRLVGQISLQVPFWQHRFGDLGLSMAERGEGFGGEAIRLVLGFAFRELNLHRVQLGVFSYNQRAYALYKKLGFVEEGRRRHLLRRDGAWHDDIVMSILEHEWEALQAGELAGEQAGSEP